MDSIEALLIAGPTASGKTALAIELARALDGVIINADSMQVYRGLEVLSAAPSAAEQADLPHRLFGIIEPDTNFSVADWHEMASFEIAECKKMGTVPILVGGTGLYFKTLLRGLVKLPEIPKTVRDSIRTRLQKAGPKSLYMELQKADPEIALELHEKDSQRICRALEVLEATGRTLREWQREPHAGALQEANAAGRVSKLVLDLPRQLLYSGINNRFAAMVESGALEEARKIMNLGLPGTAPAVKALGLRPLIDHLEGRLTLEAAVEEARRLTRNYAKRQLTWFKNQFEGWWWLDGRADDLKNQILTRVANGKKRHASL
jgi:tRNA dimethylallyltransferase